MAFLRRTALALSLMLLAFSAVPGGADGAVQGTAGAPGSASAGDVERVLGVGQTPAAIVLIVDVTYSMDSRHNNLYSTVTTEVTNLLGYLARYEPQDRVAVVLLGARNTTVVRYPLGTPQEQVGLPPKPDSSESDFGYAFQLAAQQLATASSTINVGQVLLYSDGDVTEPPSDDSVYAASNTDFSGSGWKPLKARVQALQDQGMTIVAYDVPLTVASASGQANALQQVFPTVQTLSASNPGATLASIKSAILDSKVAKAAAPDSGAGVQATWSDLRPAGPLDFSKAGHLDATLTLRALTTKIPLYLTHCSVTVPGLPGALQESLPDEELSPGKPVPVPVHLTWSGGTQAAGMFGGTAPIRGTLVLHATVLSSFTIPLQTDFNDTGFSPGGVKTGPSAMLTGTAPISANGILILLIVAVVVAALITAVVAMTWMRGTLILTSVYQVTGEVRLSRPWKSVSTLNLIDMPGRMRVRGTLRRQVRVDMNLDGKPHGDGIFKPGDRKMTAGVWVEYEGSGGDGPPQTLLGGRKRHGTF
jgi:hypothetical protein